VALDHRTRFHNVMSLRPVDRLPMIEWAGWWDKTIARWKEEGLPREMSDAAEIREYLGLDAYRQYWIGPTKPSFQRASAYERGQVTDMASYEHMRKEHLYPVEDAFDRSRVEGWAGRQARSEMVVWISLDGFFWFARKLFGIEGHLLAFYDYPEVMHAIHRDLLEYNLRILDEVSVICHPDFMTFGEDMSYNKGAMISEACFDEFIAPYYRQIVPRIKSYGTIPFIDTDGNIEQLVPWFERVGVQGFLPLERQARLDIVDLRKRNPQIRLIGGYDKMVMNRGEAAMRAEFERLLPLMRQGGYIPSVDHQTPPGVSFAEYHVYLRLLREYCEKAAG
jgi:hypothetical protein